MATDSIKAWEVLASLPLLGKHNTKDFKELATKFETKTFEGGDVIFKQGDEGDGFYIIQAGECEVYREDNQLVATLSPGDYFGEMSLVNNAARTVTVKATKMSKVLRLARDSFTKLFPDDTAKTSRQHREGVSAESPENVSTQQNGHDNVAPEKKVKSDDIKKMILNAVKYNVLFMNLTASQMETIVNEMYLLDIEKGNKIITQGDVGNHCYVVEKGTFDIYVHDVNVASLGAGKCFGELALMYNAPRAATVMSTEPSKVWVIDRWAYRKCLKATGESRLQEVRAFLETVDLLKSLQKTEMDNLATAMEEVSFKNESVVIQQGDVGRSMFIVNNGTLEVLIDDNGTSSVVAKYKAGDYFGERALLNKEERKATVKSTSDCTLLQLDESTFTLLLGPLKNILDRKVKRESTSSMSPTSANAMAMAEAAPAAMVREHENVPFDELTSHGILGKGSFGTVHLVNCKSTGKSYALKCVAKTQIVDTGQENHIMSEKDVMMKLDHPFIVRLHAAYHSADQLYFLMQLCQGGELFTLLRMKNVFPEETAKFYAASVVLAFEYMHSKDIIYRDLKPENLLINNDGYMLITDFGFAKDISSGRTWTLCGTPDYLAPEIVAGSGHGKGVDWWTLGIFLFEMLASYPPFYNDDPMKTYQKIMAGTITFPMEFSQYACKFIRQLLRNKPTKRLGVVNGGAALIKKHNFFKTFDWDKLYEKKLAPPFPPPDVKSNIDTSHFDDFEADDQMEAYSGDPKVFEEFGMFLDKTHIH